MKNFKFSVEDNVLTITVRLDEEHGLSKSGQSVVVGSTQGNVRLYDANGFRAEIVNLNVTRKVSDSEWRTRPDQTDTAAVAEGALC